MNFSGDKRSDIKVGTRFGPDANGLKHEVTSVIYDETTNTTRVSTRKLEMADRTLRFTGSTE